MTLIARSRAAATTAGSYAILAYFAAVFAWELAVALLDDGK